MSGFLHDLRIAFRTLVATPWTTGAAVLILALGTGVNTSVLAVAYGILLRPLPYADASRIVVFGLHSEQVREYGMPISAFDEWQRRQRTVDHLAAYSEGEFTLRGLGDPRVVRAAIVKGDFFDVFGVWPARGQTSVASEADRWVAVTSGLARQFGDGEAGSTLGRGVTMGQGTYVVSAVMPPSFAVPSERVAAWLPASSLTAIGFGERDARSYRLVGRLKPGVTLEQARQDATRVMREIGVAKGSSGAQATVTPLPEVLTGSVRPVLAVLVGAAILVLLVACGNVASLLVGRAIARSHDLAVRLALGASRWQLVRAVLAESLLVAVAASLAGVWIGLVLVRLFVGVAAGVMPRLDSVAIDLPVLAASAIGSLAIALLCGAAPALNVARRDFAHAFRGTAATASRRVRRLRAAIVAGQLALSIVLLTGAGLVTRTVLRLLDQATGIQPKNVVSLRLVMSDTTSFKATSRIPFVKRVLEGARRLPGVSAAAIGSALPPRNAPFVMTVRVRSEGRDETQMLTFASVTPAYFAAIGGRLVRGRVFEESDLERGESVAVLSQSAARHLSPGRDPIDRPLAFALPPERTRRPRVIGIVRDIKFMGLDAQSAAAIYVLWPDLPASTSYLVVRANQDPASLANPLHRLIRDADPSLPVPEVRALEADLVDSIADRRLRVLPAVSFACLAFAVALVGLSAIVGRAVVERGREFAIRGAVGATPSRNLRTIVGEGIGWAAAGVVLGLGAAAAAGRTLATLLYGVTPYDPLTFGGVAVLVALAALGTCYLAARRVLRLDLLQLLRE